MSSKTLPILFIFKSNQNYMTVELNTFQRHHLIESILTRLERVDKLIELFDKEKNLFDHYNDEKIILKELIEKLKYS